MYIYIFSFELLFDFSHVYITIMVYFLRNEEMNSELKKLEVEWLVSAFIATMLKSVAMVHLSVYVMSRVSSKDMAMSEIAVCAVGLVISKILESKEVGEWLVKYAKYMFLVLWIIDSIVEFYAISNPVFYVVGGYAIFTITDELVCFMFRWYKNRVWLEPEGRTVFEGRLNTWKWGSKIAGGILGLITIENIYVAVAIGLVGFSISAIGMSMNVIRIGRIIKMREEEEKGE